MEESEYKTNLWESSRNRLHWGRKQCASALITLVITYFPLVPAYIYTGRYEGAIATFNQLLDRCRKGECPPPMALSHLALVNAELGKLEEARAYIAEALEINPRLSWDSLRRKFPFKDPAHLQRVLDALSKAGLKWVECQYSGNSFFKTELYHPKHR